MKIGIITFHWGTNHGAVLQTFALYSYLKKTYNASVEIINYYPKKYDVNIIHALKHKNPKVILKKIKEFKKEKLIKKFRSLLNLTKRYYKNDELINSNLNYDILITGSDQVWNPSFLKYGENKITPVYFLNFGGKNTKKISVSASFGCESYPLDCQEIIKPLLKEFKSISVREKTGEKILKNMGLCSNITADPTSLLSKNDYLNLCENFKIIKTGSVVKMILRSQKKEIKKLISSICKYSSCKKVINIEYLSIPNWLAAIRDSSLVITNSFHCVMMCLKLHTPFVVVLETGNMSGMNDRFITLLEKFKMKNRIINNIDDFKKLPKSIDFSNVDFYMNEYEKSLKDFLERNIN